MTIGIGISASPNITFLAEEVELYNKHYLQYCGAPSKKPDYLNQGVRPLLRNS
jgi:hypothetical protein